MFIVLFQNVLLFSTFCSHLNGYHMKMPSFVLLPSKILKRSKYFLVCFFLRQDLKDPASYPLLNQVWSYYPQPAVSCSHWYHNCKIQTAPKWFCTVLCIITPFKTVCIIPQRFLRISYSSYYCIVSVLVPHVLQVLSQIFQCSENATFTLHHIATYRLW